MVRRALVLCAVVLLHGAVILFFAHSVQTVVLGKKQEAMQVVLLTAQVPVPAPVPAEPARFLPKVASSHVPERLPRKAVGASPQVESLAAPERLPTDVAPAPPQSAFQEVLSQREEQVSQPAVLASVPSRFSFQYHLAAKDGMVIQHGESTLMFDGGVDTYVADFGWTLGDEKGLVRSEGKLLATLSPSVYMDTNQSPRPMSGLVQDSVSMIWMLRQVLVQREEKSTLGNNPSSGDFSMLVGNEVMPYRWEILQTDELMLPGGTVDGILLQSDSKVPGLPIFSIWFTPSRPYVPVRIRRTDSTGKVIDHLLKDNLTDLGKIT